MQLHVMFCIGPPLMQWAGQTSPEMNQRFAVKEASLYRTTSHLQQNAQSQMNKSLVVKLVEYWPEKSILVWPWPQSTLIRSHALHFCFPFHKYLSKTSIWKPFRAFLKSRVVVLWIHATLWFEAIWKQKKLRSPVSQPANLKAVDTYTALYKMGQLHPNYFLRRDPDMC